MLRHPLAPMVLMASAAAVVVAATGGPGWLASVLLAMVGGTLLVAYVVPWRPDGDE